MVRITHVALRTKNGTIFKSQQDGASLIYEATKRGYDEEDYETGFLTNDGEFVNREMAAIIAFNAEQTKTRLRELRSCDLILK